VVGRRMRGHEHAGALVDCIGPETSAPRGRMVDAAESRRSGSDSGHSAPMPRGGNGTDPPVSSTTPAGPAGWGVLLAREGRFRARSGSALRSGHERRGTGGGAGDDAAGRGGPGGGRGLQPEPTSVV